MRITTQVLDSVHGQSAVGVRVRLERASGNGWATISDAETNSEGCIEDWGSWHLERGLYRIAFDTDGYYASLGANTAYPEVVIIFRMPSEPRALQVQVMLSPYSYSTFFGTIKVS